MLGVSIKSSSPGCAASMFSPWERVFACISLPHPCVHNYRQERVLSVCESDASSVIMLPWELRKVHWLEMFCWESFVKHFQHFREFRAKQRLLFVLIYLFRCGDIDLSKLKSRCQNFCVVLIGRTLHTIFSKPHN